MSEMPVTNRASRTLLLTAATLLAVIPSNASAVGAAPAKQGPTVVSVAAAQFYGYATPAMVVEKGGELSYTNFDIVQHDVVHDVAVDGVANKKKSRWCKRFKRKECPLFWSPRAGLGDTVAVKGLGNVSPGEVYSFFCTLHPGMKGNLVVVS